MSCSSKKKIKLSNEEKEETDDSSSGMENVFKAIVLYILPNGIGPKRLNIMKSSATKNGFNLSSSMTSYVTHILTELSFKEDVLRAQDMKDLQTWNGYILETQWLAECVKSHSLVSEIPYLLPSLPSSQKKLVPDEEVSDVNLISGFDLNKFNSCVAERRAILDHPNKDIADALDSLKEYWTIYHQSKNDKCRALAFARAAAAVKCLPFKVENPAQLKGIKDLGDGHALRVATQVVETGQCPEVEEKRNDPKFLSLKTFCTVYGAGPSIAKKWYDLGLRTIEDVKKRFGQLDINDDKMITYGVAFYDDLNKPLLLTEAKKTYKYITDLAKVILPSVVSSMNGGFRRGKSTGHDLDVLFSYPERDYGLIAAVHDELDKKGLVIWSRIGKVDEPKTIETDSSSLPTSSYSNPLLLRMVILKYPLDGRFDEFVKRDFSAEKNAGAFELAASNRDWQAIRVDLVGSTNSQYPYAQVGWTGNKQYNRCLRQYAKDSLGYSLSSSGLYDMRQHRWIAAQTEQDVFHHLKLTYREPWERNF